jgi:hypothetical protein
MYGPNLTEFGAVSVRRLAWAIGTNMAEAIDFMALYLPQKMEKQNISCIDDKPSRI